MKKLLIITLSLVSICSISQNGWTALTPSVLPILNQNIPGKYLGASWVDINGDDRIDLFAAPNKLFLNQGNGTFLAIDTLNFTPIKNNGVNFVGGSSWADLNDDGLPDCVIASEPSRVFKNNGNSTFTDVSPQIPNLNTIPSWGCAIGDWNKDKYLDFYFAHASGFHSNLNTTGRLYLNTTSSLTPLNKINYAITDSLRPYTVPYWSDFDLDGDMDLFVASGPGGSPGYDYCYRNLKIELGSDSLQRMTNNLFTQQKQDGQCYNFIDYDNDEDFDLCLTNYAGAVSKLYRNDGGTYTIVSTPWSSTLPFLANCWGDYDNDGDLDMVTSSDNFSTRYYQNNGNGTFTQISGALSLPPGSAGIVNCDFDNDGDLDLFVHGSNSARAFFKNDTLAGSRKWVNIKFIGNPSNKSAIGTIIKTVATINTFKTYQLREINAQNSFQGQNDLRVHFGLGNATVIDTMYIKWPSGNKQTVTNIIPNQFYTIIEGGSLNPITSVKNLTLPGQDLTIFPNPSGNIMFIKSNSESISERIEIFSLDGKKILDLENHNGQIETSKLKSGTYVMRFKVNAKNVSRKIVIEK